MRRKHQQQTVRLSGGKRQSGRYPCPAYIKANAETYRVMLFSISEYRQFVANKQDFLEMRLTTGDAEKWIVRDFSIA